MALRSQQTFIYTTRPCVCARELEGCQLLVSSVGLLVMRAGFRDGTFVFMGEEGPNMSLHEKGRQLVSLQVKRKY